jgi:hypothetical protein
VSLICGVYVLRPQAAIPETWKSHLRRAICRTDVGVVREVDESRLFVLHHDVGAYAESGGNSSPTGDLSIVTGDPLFKTRTSGGGRAHDSRVLLNAAFSEIPGLLASARGNFNCLRYIAANGNLLLACDRLGGRPIYWMRNGNFLLFSGARRVFAGLPGLDLEFDNRGLIESLAFGFPLGVPESVVSSRWSTTDGLRGGSALSGLLGLVSGCGDYAA